MAKTAAEIATERLGQAPGDGVQTGAVPSYVRNIRTPEQQYRVEREGAHDPGPSVNQLEKELGVYDQPRNIPNYGPEQLKQSYADIIGKNVKEIFPQAVAGAIDGVNEIINTSIDLSAWVADKLKKDYDIGFGSAMLALGPEDQVHNASRMYVAPPETPTGNVVHALSQFMVGFLPSNKALQGVSFVQKAGGGIKVAAGMGAGAIADFSVFDPHQDRISEVIQRYPSLANPITEYLAGSPKDTELEGRFKNTLEGMGMGAMTEGLMMAFRGYRAWRGLNNPSAKQVIEQVAATEQAAIKPMTAAETKALGPGENPVRQADLPGMEITAGSPPSAPSADKLLADRKIPGSEVDAGAPPPAPAQAAEAPLEKAPMEPGGPAVVPSRIVEPEVDMRAWDLGGAKSAEIVSAKDAAGLKDGVKLPTGDLFRINLTKLESEKDITNALKQISKVVEPTMTAAKRGRLSDTSVEDLAFRLGMRPSDLYNRLGGEAYNAEQVRAAQFLVDASAKNLRARADIIAAGNASTADRAAFVQSVAAQLGVYQALRGSLSEAGRSLRTAQMQAKSQREMLAQMNDMIRNFGGEREVEVLADAISKLTDTRSINRVIQKSFSRRIQDAAVEVYTNGLLSGPRTVVVNVLGNTAAVFGKITERYAAEGISAVRQLVQDDPYRIGVAPGEATAMVSSLLGGVNDGFYAVVKAMREGTPTDSFTQVEILRNPALTAQNFNLTGNVGKTVDYLGSAIRIPGRTAALADKFFQVINYRMELYAEATRAAQNQNLFGHEREKFFQNFVLDPPDAIKMRSIQAARENTFSRELPENLDRIVDAVHAYPAARIVVPFVRTNINIADYALQRMPILNRVSPRMAEEIAAGGARADVANAKLAVGSSVMAVTALLAANGYVTGTGPANPDAKKLLEMSGWRPNSVKVGDTYYSYNRVDPFGMILGMAADFSEIAGHTIDGDRDVEQVLLSSMAAVGNNLVTEQLIENLVDFGEALTDPERRFKPYFTAKMASTVPNFLNQIANQSGDQRPLVREESMFKEAMNRVRARIPGYSDELPPQRNLFGEVVTYDPGVGPDMVSPIYTSVEKDSPARKEIARMVAKDPKKYYFGMPSDIATMGPVRVKLSNAEYSKVVEYSGTLKHPVSGRTMEEELNFQLANNFPGFGVNAKLKELTDNRYAMMRDIIDGFQKYAVNKFIKEQDNGPGSVAERAKLQMDQMLEGKGAISMPGGVQIK